jgi:hypothetical protein
LAITPTAKWEGVAADAVEVEVEVVVAAVAVVVTTFVDFVVVRAGAA